MSAFISCFQAVGRLLLNERSLTNSVTFHRRYRAMFVTSPEVCAILWQYITPFAPSDSKPKHLLWALLFQKNYNSEHVNRSITGADEKTLRKWVWCFVELLTNIHVVKDYSDFSSKITWGSRLRGREESVYKCSVDGVDFEILEPTPFDTKWYSHKFKGPGLRYEVGVGIASGNICWAHGPFPCGAYSDLKIFQLGMKTRLLRGERVVADGGYRDERSSYNYVLRGQEGWGYFRARHEAFNKRLRHFQVLRKRFRHFLSRHSICFHSVANITYLLIDQGEPIFNEDALL